MDHAFTNERAAIIAASQASDATAELLRYISEGPYSDRTPFGETDVVAKLAEALNLSLDLEGEPRPDTHLDDDELALLANLKIAVSSFIAGWVG
jgi:hypothetical protein